MTPGRLLQGFRDGRWMLLKGAEALPQQLLPPGPGVLVSSGGSSGGRRICLQPLVHLDQSAAATAHWLHGLGLDPGEVLICNPLPMHHVSGLMPWWRSRCWGVPHLVLEPGLLKQPQLLLEFCEAQSGWGQRPALLSLVPTQLGRLLADPSGIDWLQRFSVIWVGGAALPAVMADQARQVGIRLAPCYGATETAAMVAALPPERFLQGDASCGTPLMDVALRLAADGALEVKTSRLAIACWRPEQPQQLQGLSDASGWWRSGDRAVLEGDLHILGRLDGAVLSGGETVFPDQLEARLLAADLPLEAVLLLGIPDAQWGEQLVGLVRSSTPDIVERLQDVTQLWPAAERPKRWLLCPELAPSEAGKWQRSRWQAWLQSQESVHPPERNG
jgi:O-succinylbenzoic acid--CoA ligase|tara:strand:- start:1390 stop:2553 length:1164 start_codon:yes stop_codon:yes gene_type:complete